MKLYGSLDNRLEEGHNFNKDGLIHESDDITMYYYSDCTCYYVTRVVNQKNIFVHKYEVCADHSKEGGMGHQDWLYFKTLAEHNKYLNSCHLKNLNGDEYYYDENVEEDADEEWAFRYNHWNRVDRWNKQLVEEVTKRDGFVRCDFTDKEKQILDNGGEVVKYSRIDEGISFGVRNYYYDWSF